MIRTLIRKFINLIKRIFRFRRKPVNRNGRIYTEAAVRNAIDEFNKKVQMSSSYVFMGEIQHPEDGPLRVDNARVVMRIQSVRVKKDNVFGRLFNFWRR